MYFLKVKVENSPRMHNKIPLASSENEPKSASSGLGGLIGYGKRRKALVVIG